MLQKMAIRKVSKLRFMEVSQRLIYYTGKKSQSRRWVSKLINGKQNTILYTNRWGSFSLSTTGQSPPLKRGTGQRTSPAMQHR